MESLKIVLFTAWLIAVVIVCPNHPLLAIPFLLALLVGAGLNAWYELRR